MDPQTTLQRYIDAWNAHDAGAIVATFAPGGTYADPTTPGPLSGEAIGEYAKGLWTAFPDVAFEVRSRTSQSEGLMAFEWVMTGTNSGPFNGQPPTVSPELPASADAVSDGTATLQRRVRVAPTW